MADVIRACLRKRYEITRGDEYNAVGYPSFRVAVVRVTSIYCAQRLLLEIFTITLRHCYFVVTCNPYMASNNKILLSLYGKYLAMDLDCDDTRQVV